MAIDCVVIENVLQPELFDTVRQLAVLGVFEAGAATAHGSAQSVKRNEQLQSTQATQAVLETVGRTLSQHPVVQAFAIPKLMTLPMLSRYRDGMEYGWHVDSPFMGDVRTDLSYTLFLDAPDSFDGGELVLAVGGGTQRAFKLPAGSMVLYHTGLLHRVAPVTRGERRAVVGWIQSRIRLIEQREVLGKLMGIRDTLPVVTPANETLALQTNECVQQLTRLWGE